MRKLPADYVTIGHLTKDIADDSYTLGGTAAYASLTAVSFGLDTALVSSHSKKLNIKPLHNIAIYNKHSPTDTTFENIETPSGRVQFLREIAEPIDLTDIPKELASTPIVHIGPVANEASMEIIDAFHSHCLIGITPQGWMRQWGDDGQVRYKLWVPPAEIIQRADAVVISDEDVCKDEAIIHHYAQIFSLLVVTEGFNGARVYWHGEMRRFSAPKMMVLDPTGAGDIFATAFFIRLQATKDAWVSAETAVRLASLSVTRRGLDSIPRPEEVKSNIKEIIKGSSC